MRRLPGRSLAALAAAIGSVGLVTALVRAHVVPLRSLASSPDALAEGKVWTLVTSGLVVSDPLVLSSVSFVAMALLVLAVRGPRVLVAAALVGHVASTLVVYGALDLTRLLDPGAYSVAVRAPDFGVSAMQAAWVGVLAAAAWRGWARGSAARRATVAAACAVTGAVAWAAGAALTVIDSEHGLAFVLGIVLVAVPWRSLPVPPRLVRALSE